MARYVLINTTGVVRAGSLLDTDKGDRIDGLQALGGVLVALPNTALEAAAEKAREAYARGAGDAVANGIMLGAYTEQATPPTPSPAAILLADIAELTAYDVTSLSAGMPAYVATVDDTYELVPAGGLTVESTVVVPANDGGAGVAQWKRTCTPSRRWLEQTEWYIDSDTGDDEATGLSGSPLASFAELLRRVGRVYQPVNPTTIYLLTNLPVNDPLNLVHVGRDDGFATVQNQLFIFGLFASFDSGTTTASTGSTAGTNTQGQVTIDNSILAGEGLSFMRNASTGAFAPVMDTASPDTSYQNQWIAAAPGLGGSGTPASNPTVGQVVEVGSFPTVSIGELRSTMDGGVALYRVTATISGLIENAYVVNCSTFYGTLQKCTIQASYCFAAIVEICSLSAGMVTGSCTTTQGGVSFNISCRLGSIDGSVGFICKGGVSNVVGNAIIPDGAAFSVEIENATLVLEVTNSLYGGDSPIKLRSGAVLRRRQALGINPNKTGTAVVWDTADSPFRITGATPTFTQLTTNTWDSTSGYSAAANTNVQHLQSSARIITAP